MTVATLRAITAVGCSGLKFDLVTFQIATAMQADQLAPKMLCSTMTR